MGGFLLLSVDERIGVSGEVAIGLNEVAIGMTLPWFAIEIARHRLTRTAFDRCTVTGALLDPQSALSAGFLDRVVEPEQLGTAAAEAAVRLKSVNRDAYAATKLRVREGVLAGIRDGVDRIADPDREM